ncbi:hypothetical protein ACFL6P_01735 [Candidatus Latescibacterota bacterium]
MKVIKIFSVVILLLSMVIGFATVTQARVMMTATINEFSFSVLPTATFTVDDWLSNPNLWTLQISTDRNIMNMKVKLSVTTPTQGEPIAEGTVTAIGPGGIQELLPAGGTFVLNNTMFTDRGGNDSIDDGSFSDDFVDKVLEIGYLPEGMYVFEFRIVSGFYSNGQEFTADDFEVETGEIEVNNPLPPELMTPDQDSDDVVSIPRFTWQRPAVTDLSKINGVGIQILYSLKLWRMFEDDGSILSEEEAINRIPIWQVDNFMGEAIDFDPGTSREDLISGRKYCWQVQAFDGQGRFISQTNEGKSDAWVFTVQFSPPALNEPQTFFPLAVSWSPASTGGGQVYYRIRIAEDPDFTSAYEEMGLMMTSYNYPSDAPALQRGTVYYFEVQTTDDSDIPLGEPEMISFEIPPVEVSLMSPDDGSDSPSRTPTFTWTGNSDFYVVSIYDEASDRTNTSSEIAETRWIYEGEELQQGATYVWTVTPTNENGDPIGDSSEAWSFTLPSQNEASLISPVNEAIETILPLFTWNEIPPSPNQRIVYTISIMDSDDTVIHEATVSEAQYQYPQDAAQLEYSSRFTWMIVAQIEGAAASWESSIAWFSTPFVVVAGEDVSMDSMNEALQVVMGDFSEFDEFADMVLSSISDETGPLTAEQLVEIINDYKIVQVNVE